jgi:DNA-binding Lrp family transcriptional regulator
MIKLDEIDKEILTLLGRNGRTSGSQISKDLTTVMNKSMTDRAALQRIDRLENRKIIQGYTTILNSDIVAEKTSIILLLKFVTSAERTKIDKLNAYLSGSSFCLTAARLSGGGGGIFDYICHLVFDTERQFCLELNVLYRAFGDLISDHLVNKSTIVKQVPYTISFDRTLEARKKWMSSIKLGPEEIYESKKIKDKLQQFVNDFMGCFGARYVCLWLIDRDADELMPAFFSDIAGDQYEYEKLSRYIINIGLILQTMTPVLSNDLARDFKITIVNWITGKGVKSYAGYPLIQENRVRGVLEMYGDKNFSSAEFELAEVVSSELAGELVNIGYGSSSPVV